jgi:hypothetical protein
MVCHKEKTGRRFLITAIEVPQIGLAPIRPQLLYTKYGIGFMHLIACQTGDVPYRDTWRKNVATRETSIGYRGKTAFWSREENKVTRPGTNP